MSDEKDLYWYEAEVKEVTDGDTFEAEVNLGFKVTSEQTFRLKGIDTPETYRPENDKELEHGQKAKNFVKNLMEGEKVKLKPYGKGSFGRWLCDIYVEDKNVVQLLKENGYEKKESY